MSYDVFTKEDRVITNSSISPPAFSFAFLTKGNKLCSDIINCKDNLNDFLYSVAHPKNGKIAKDMSVNKKNGGCSFPDLANFRLLISAPISSSPWLHTEKDFAYRTAVCNNMLKFIGMRDRIKIEVSRPLNGTTGTNSFYVISIPRALRKMPPLMSAIISIYRAQTSSSFANKDVRILEFIGNTIGPDANYLAVFVNGLNHIKIRNPYRYFRGKMLDNWNSIVFERKAHHAYFGCNSFGAAIVGNGAAHIPVEMRLSAKNYTALTKLLYS